MIFGGAALCLNMFAMLAFSLLVTVVVVSLAITLKPRLLYQYAAPTRIRLLWLLASLPWSVGALAAALTIASMYADVWLPPAYELLHWHHPFTFIAKSWHGLAAALFVLAVSMLMVSNIAGLLKNARHLKMLHRFSTAHQGRLFELEAEVPIAFTAGVIHPRCYITTSLRHRVDDTEYAIIQLHEQAHASRRDPFKKWLFRLLTSFFPAGTARYLNQSMGIAMEQCADAEVSRVIHDKSLIAKTLLKVQRLASAAHPTALCNSMACHFVVDGLEERIRYLLGDNHHNTFPALSLMAATVAMAVVCAFSADTFHHAIEFLFTH